MAINEESITTYEAAKILDAERGEDDARFQSCVYRW